MSSCLYSFLHPGLNSDLPSLMACFKHFRYISLLIQPSITTYISLCHFETFFSYFFAFVIIWVMRQGERRQANSVTHQAGPNLSVLACFCFVSWADWLTDTLCETNEHLFGRGLVGQRWNNIEVINDPLGKHLRHSLNKAFLFVPRLWLWI